MGDFGLPSMAADVYSKGALEAMHLDPVVRDYRLFVDNLIDAIESDSTHLYLDTSLLMWLVRVGAHVRKEFVAWCDTRPANSVKVPVWAGHELQRHILQESVRDYLQKTVREAEAKLDDFRRLASEHADEAGCRAKGYAGRDSYIGEVEQSSARLIELARVMEDRSLLVGAADEVITFVNSHLLATDIWSIIEKVSCTGDFRYSHFIPPGFHDKKESNRYGDVMIWEELIQDVASAGPGPNGRKRHAILVSRDSKTDWVSSALHLRGARGEIQKGDRTQGFDAPMVHPLLAHEFSARAGGHHLYVTTPGFLATVVDHAARRSNRPSYVSHWLAATYRPDLLERRAALTLLEGPEYSAQSIRTAAPVGRATTSLDRSQSTGPTSTALIEELQTLATRDVMAPSVVSEVRSYQLALPPEGADFINSWLDALKDESLTPIKFGRILAELAISNVPGVVTQLSAVVERLSSILDSSTLNRVALALITSVYFDRYGELYRRPQKGLGSVALSLETRSNLSPAFSALRQFLSDANATLPYLPGSGRPTVSFAVKGVGAGRNLQIINDLRLGDDSILADQLPVASSRRLTALLGREPSERCTLTELQTLVAGEYLVPSDRLATQPFKQKLTWGPDAGLMTLDTGSEGGVSELADEEEIEHG